MRILPRFLMFGVNFVKIGPVDTTWGEHDLYKHYIHLQIEVYIHTHSPVKTFRKDCFWLRGPQNVNLQHMWESKVFMDVVIPVVYAWMVNDTR